ncbi:MAG TPA: hypothetical protein VFT72_15270 [Opitutaceae bacterium]|nr:hypothetical protein [Opitutaceae bacterium]
MLPLRIARVLVILGLALSALPLCAESLSAQIEKARAQPKVIDRLNALSAIGPGLTSAEIPRALELANTLDVLRERAVFEETVLKRWAKLAPADAFAFTATLPDSRQKIEVLRAAADALARKNSSAAAQAAAALPSGRARQEAIATTAEIWAAANAPAALRWAETLEPAPARETALHAIRFVWVHTDPAAAAAHVTALPSSDVKNALLMNIGGSWAERDPSAAIAWAQTLDPGPEQTAALVNIAESWADSAPALAATFAISLPPEPRSPAVGGVTARWATQKPAEAAAWTTSLDPALRPVALAALLDVWTGAAPDVAEKWIQKLPPGSLRDDAAAAYVTAVDEWNPQLAAEVIPLVHDEARRAQSARELVDHWSEIDPAAARQWSAKFHQHESTAQPDP